MYRSPTRTVIMAGQSYLFYFKLRFRLQILQEKLAISSQKNLSVKVFAGFKISPFNKMSVTTAKAAIPLYP